MKKQLISRQQVAGFTLIETLIVITMVGVLAAIAAPSWFALINKQRLNTAQDQALRVMREAQQQAKNRKLCWEVSFRDDGTKVQWSTHLPSVVTDNCTTIAPATGWIWNNLAGEDAARIAIDTSPSFSTLNHQNGAYRIQFQFDGWVNGQLGRITFKTRNSSVSPKRCVFVSTTLGAMRTAENEACQQAESTD